MRGLKLFVSVFFILAAAWLFGQGRFASSFGGKTFAGGETPSAPTGVSASDADYADKVGVMWNTVRGANLYRVFRNTENNSASAVAVGTTAANYFFDATAVAAQNYFYWVRAENGSAASDFSQSDQGMRAVGNFSNENFSPFSTPPAPAGNPVTATKAYLGKTLFWDEQLSSTYTVACGTCHRPSHGGSDPRTVVNNANSTNPGFDNVFNTADDVSGSPGVPQNALDGNYSPSTVFGFGEQVTPRKTPSYLNAGLAFNGSFWDGRAANVFRDPLTNQILLNDWASYESQVISPPISSAEMGHSDRNWTQVAEQISNAKPLALASDIPVSLSTWINGRTYPQLFEEAFGTPEVTPARIAMAIATHERTIFTDRTPYDKWASNIESLTAQEIRGSQIFVQSNCVFCHGGPLLADQNFHNVGVRPQAEDIGRAVVTGSNNDRARFKTPSLRNLELRAPYMHNGRFQTVEEVVEFYNRGGDFAAPNKDVRVRPLNLTVQQRADLVAFLKRPLTDPRVANELPPFDRPKLYTETNRVPVLTGTGRAGTNGIVPKALAIEPPIVGNPNFTVAVSDCTTNANAVLVIDSNDPGVGATIPANGSLARISINTSSSASGGYGSISIQIPNNPALVNQTFYGRWYINDSGAANGFSVSQAFRFTIFGAASQTFRKANTDFDGDGKTDVSVFRPSNGAWYVSNSSNGSFGATVFGVSTDVLTPADFDGDGKTDIAVFRNGTWYLQRSQAGFTAIQFGASGDKPAAADYDCDGKADVAVFRPSNGTWYLQKSLDGFAAVQFGIATDKPIPADYDGDGKTDIAVFRDGTWYILKSRDGFTAVQFGAATDKLTVGDYDGDGKANIAVFRPSNGFWYFLRSEDGSFAAVNFGAATDLPTPGDFDADGKSDFAVFRPSEGVWYILNSGNGSLRTQLWGAAQDFPIPASIVP